MGRFIDLSNQKFGRLTVLSRAENDNQGKPKWLCRCECGESAVVNAHNLRHGSSKSCGCLQKEINGNIHRTHGDTGTRLYKIWKHMKGRTLCVTDKAFYKYGERGIEICEEWVNNYPSFKQWALANGYKNNLSIDRINNNGNYEPSNCRWADGITQCNNTRRNHLITYNGKTNTISQWAREKGLKPPILWARLFRYGWSLEKAMEQPIRHLI